MFQNGNVIDRSPLEQAIDQESAEWLELVHPLFHKALVREIKAGKTIEDIVKILWHEFNGEVRKPLEARLIQAYRHL